MKVLNLMICIFVLFVFCASVPSNAETISTLWQKVNKAKGKGLPKTAIKHLKQISEMAKQNGDAINSVKALCEQIVQEGHVQGNKPEEKIVQLQSEIDKAEKSIKPMLNIILAKWYWHYYSRNRYRFMNRSRTEGLSGKDFTTWDLPKLFAHIGNLYENVLNNEDELKKIPISKFEGFIEQGNQPTNLRKTMFDFFAHEALDFYMNDDQSSAKPNRAFEVEADSPALKDVKAFLSWEPKSFDKESCNFRAIKLLQRLISFNIKSGNRDASLNNDLFRLKWVKKVAVGEDISENYIKQLTQFANENSDSPYSAIALGYIAQEYLSLKEPVTALKYAEKGIIAFPNSHGASICNNVKYQILNKTINVRIERVLLPDDSKFTIEYKNITKVYFRLIERNTSELTNKKNSYPDSINWDYYGEILGMDPVQTWSKDLEPTDTYQQQEMSFDFPNMKPGLYYLATSVREDFAGSKNSLKISPVIVSKLGMVLRKNQGKNEIFVLNSISGQPVPNVKVKQYQREYNKPWNVSDSKQTDENGIAKFPSSNGGGFYLTEYKNHLMFKPYDFHSYMNNNTRSDSKVFFFTDRSLYRPGQTVFYKGVAVYFNTASNEYKTVSGKSVSVSLRDPNRQEVEQKKFVTNEFGSFHGSFIAPADRLTGRYQIISSGISGSTQFKVEEYKRPKFKVDLEVPSESFQLNKIAKIKGNAVAYTGAKIDSATVKYRVVREVRYPSWCWWYPRTRDSSQEISHGVTTTGIDGSFTIEFTAKPDRNVAKENEPIFSFRIYADVTDSNGETRSDNHAINLGYTAQTISLSVPENSKANVDVPVTVTTATLDGKGLPSAGTLLVYSLKQPNRPQRKPYTSNYYYSKTSSEDKNLSDPKHWEEDKVVFEKSFNTSINGVSTININLPEGAYRIKAKGQDKFNNKIKALNDFIVIEEKSDTFSIKIPSIFNCDSTVMVGSEFNAMWGTGYDVGPAYVEVEHKNKILWSYWTDSKKTRKDFGFPITDEFRGGFTVRVMQVKDNREYFYSKRVNVPWDNKDLKVSFSHMSSKLEPGQKDTWKIKISGKDADFGAIEMLAAMYDASLDAFSEHSWQNKFPIFYSDSSSVRTTFSNNVLSLNTWKDNLNGYSGISSRSFPKLPRNIVNDFLSYGYSRNIRFSKSRSVGMLNESLAPAPMMSKSAAMPELEGDSMSASIQKSDSFAGSPKKKMSIDGASAAPGGGANKDAEPNLDKVSARKNLNETAFFYPNLLTDKDGSVTIEFTVPEALTTWKFMGFAHGTACQTGGLIGETVTQKDLMVQPNPPRFLREGDKLKYTAKITNMSDTEQSGKIRLSLLDSVTDKVRNKEFAVVQDTFEFSIPAGQSKAFGWMLNVPETPGIVKYKVVAATNKLSDGEEGLLPILSRRIFVTEAMPLPIRGPATKKFLFKKLVESKKSSTLKHQGLTVEVTSNPAWYAVQALPYLMEYPHECSEQVFNRIYANEIAAFIANSNPKIRKVFDTWKADEMNGGKALYSNLEKNEHLKSVALLETPWVLDAKSETEAKHKIGTLFDRNRLESELQRGLKKLANMQLSDGGFPWFPGGKPNSFITLYIMTGFGRMRHLGADIDVKIAIKSLTYLDRWINKYYRDIMRNKSYKTNTNINPTVALYLYGRSFFLKERGIPSSSKEAVEFFLDEAKEKWLKVNSRLAQGHLAIALKRFKVETVPMDIVNSIRERSVSNDEMGMFWRENELSFWWYRAEIETQALMIEMFDEVANDDKSVEDCKVWLLKQKQTQNWKTTKATSDAVYALLLKGSDLLASDKLVRVSLGGKEVKPEKVEAGTGYYQKIYSGAEVLPEMGKIKVKKEDKGVAWGAVHWQYLEDMSKVTPHETNLKLKKTLFVKKNTDKGPTITPVNGPLKIGDLVVVRIELKTDRDMEYIHMKDQRGSGMEPVSVISRYKYQDGLAYYEATKDTASHFYIDYLPKGTYVFEYNLRIQQQGVYQSGMAEIQCMYAPEFNSHSQSFVVNVK